MTPEQIAQARARLTEITNELRAMHDRAGDRALSPTEQQQWDALEEERQRLDREMRAAVLASPAHFGGEGGSGPDSDAPNVNTRGTDPWAEIRQNGPNAVAPAEVRARARTALERCESLPDDARERAGRLLEVDDTRTSELVARYTLIASDPDYMRAFARVLRDPANGPATWSEHERNAYQRADMLTRSLNLGDGPSGSYLVPFELDPSIIISSDGSTNPFRQIARVEQTITNKWNGVSSEGITARWAAEESEAGDNSPAFDQPTVDVHKADAFVPFSIEWAQDAVNATRELQRLFMGAKDDLEAVAFVSGDGDGKPQGVVTALGAGQTVNTGGAFTADSLYALRAAVPPRFRARLSWLAELGVYQAVRQFDTAGGADLWVQLGGTEPNQLVGHAAYESSEMHNDPTTDGEDILVAGDFRQYLIADRLGMTVELVPHLFGENGRPTGQRGLYAYWRVGGDVLVPNAFRKLTKTASG